MSATTTTCLGTIIGLSKTTCECFEDYPVGYSVSDSGLYLDEMFDPQVIQSLVNCSHDGDMWQLLDNSRSQAIIQFNGDVTANLLSRFKLRRPVFKGQLGRLKYSTSLSLSAGDYAGIRLYCADVVSGTMLIPKIGAMFASSGTIDVYVYNSLNEQVAGPYTITVEAYKHSVYKLTTPLELPLHRDEIENIEYYLIYQNSGINPLNIDVDCNCGQVLKFNTHYPYYKTQTAKQKGWQQWVMSGGFKSNDISDLSSCTSTAQNYTYGLTLPDLELKCNIQEVICNGTLDFLSDPLALSYAFAVRYKAAELVASMILLSPDLNREIMVQSEQWQADVEHWRSKYSQYLQYIVDNLDVTVNDCLMCYDKVPVMKKTILA